MSGTISILLAKCLTVNRKWLRIIIILGLAGIIFLVRQWQQGRENKGPEKTGSTRTVDRDRGFDRRTQFLKFSQHAKCRMECRQITKQEVEEIMKEGKINYKKSDLRNNRCPRYTIEGVTDDNQRVRIVYAQCNESTTVVTVIDLGKEWSCDCPGDDHASVTTQTLIP